MSQRPPSPGRREKFAFSPKKRENRFQFSKIFKNFAAVDFRPTILWLSDDAFRLMDEIRVAGREKKKGKEQNQEKKNEERADGQNGVIGESGVTAAVADSQRRFVGRCAADV